MTRAELSEGQLGAQLLLGPALYSTSGVEIYEGRGRGAQLAVRSKDSVVTHLMGGMIDFGTRRGQGGTVTTALGGGREGSLLTVTGSNGSHVADFVKGELYVDTARFRTIVKER